MKKVTLAYLFTLVLISFTGFSMAQTKIISYKFIGTISSQEELIEGAEIRVFEENELLSTTYSDKKGKFEVELMKGGEYVIEMSIEGYYPKRVIFRTNVAEDVKKLPALKFEAELTSTAVYQEAEESNPASTSILDFPSAIIEYDPEIGDFNYRRVYSEHVLEEIKKIGTD